MLVDMYEDGESVAKLGKEYDVSRPTIYNWIKQFISIELDADGTTDLNEVMKFKREMSKLKEENEVLKKSLPYFEETVGISLEEKVQFIEEHRDQPTLSILLKVAKLSKSSYFEFKNRKVSQ